MLLVVSAKIIVEKLLTQVAKLLLSTSFWNIFEIEKLLAQVAKLPLCVVSFWDYFCFHSEDYWEASHTSSKANIVYIVLIYFWDWEASHTSGKASIVCIVLKLFLFRFRSFLHVYHFDQIIFDMTEEWPKAGTGRSCSKAKVTVTGWRRACEMGSYPRTIWFKSGVIKFEWRHVKGTYLDIEYM